MKSLLILFLTAFLLSLILVPLTRIWFIRLGKLDHPGERKLHRQPVPRSGGLAVMTAYLAALAILMLLPAGGNYVLERYGNFLTRLIPAIALVCITGIADDWLDIAPSYKLTGQLIAAAFAYWAGIRLFDTTVGYEWLAFPATAFWLVLCSNAFNLTDGTDGLAGSLAIVSCLGLILVSLALDYYALALLFTPLLGAVLPFLRANWPPARLFLGDTGSLTLGFLIGCGGAALSRRFPAGEGFSAAVLILTLPLMEVCLSTARRLLRGNPIFAPDSFHIHHQLKRQGKGDSEVLLRLGILSLMGTSIAVVQIWMTPVQRVLLIGPYLFYLGFKVASLRYPEFNVLWEAILGGRIRQWLRHQILLRVLEEDLKTATDSSRAIAILEAGAKQLGLFDLNIRLPGRDLDSILPESDLSSTYLVRIDLPNRSWVNFRVPVHLKRTENPASDFAAVVIRSFSLPRLERLQQAARSALHPPEATLLSDQSA